MRRLYPIERIVLLATAATTVLYVLLQMPPRTRIDFYIKQIIWACDNYALGLIVCAGMVLSLSVWRRGNISLYQSLRSGWTRFLELFLSRKALTHDFRLVVAVLLTLALFTHLKHIIPLINPALYDGALVRMEQTLFGGKILSQILIDLLGVQAASVMSWGYTAYYVYMNAIFMVFILQRNQRLAQEFCAAFSLLWIVGIVMVYAAPTWGPCFFLPDLFHVLPSTDVTTLQQQLWYQKMQLDRDPFNANGIFLISGQPSLHIAVTVLGSFYLAQLSRMAAGVSWCFAGLTWVTTLYLGWHYLLDNVLALLLVWLAVRGARSMLSVSRY